MGENKLENLSINDLTLNDLTLNEKSEIIQQYKVIYDNIHGFIHLSNLGIMIIDSRQFQRLRKLKQLGSCYYVYQNAIHSRFEHSIGTSYLAGKIMECIMINTPPIEIENYMSKVKELNSYYNRKYDGKMHIIDNYIIELVKIAALCHDLGHGPFSHVFDDFFLPNIKKHHENGKHEIRSGILLEQIIKENSTLSSIINIDEINFMKNLINPNPEHTGFIYQIISNYLNGLDVDKYDYIARDSNMLGISSKFRSQRLVEHIRVINDIICYPEQTIGDIIELFTTRYNLHKTVYSHKAVIAAQFMITEIFSYLDNVIGLSESINNMNKFCTMTDEYILTCHNILQSDFCKLSEEHMIAVKNAKYVIDRLDSHKLYAHIDTYITNNKLNITIDNFKSGEKNKIMIFTNKIGLVSGSKKNPLDCVYSYRTKDTHRQGKLEMKKIDIIKYSLLIANNYQECITMAFYKDKDEEIINKLRNEFREIVKLQIKN